jgi:anaerobic nitric oxide reductase transcription regulator
VPIPPLRERGNDVLLLAGRFLELNRARLGLRSLRLSPDAQGALRRYRWPGNVRELEHVISRAALKALSRGVDRNEIVTLEAGLLDLDALEAPAPAAQPAAAPAAGAASAVLDGTLRDVVDACQRQAVTAALDRHQGNWAQAARALDVDPSNLHKLARRLGLKG